MRMTGLTPTANLLRATAMIVIAALAAATANAADKKPFYPGVLQGIWYDHDADGSALCQAYKNADKRNSDAVSGLLVGAVLISGPMMHAYSEYGEGNFYELRGLKKTGRDEWRVAVASGIDTSPETFQPRDNMFLMRLAKSTLTIKAQIHPIILKESLHVRYRLRRCADLPADFYTRRAKVQDTVQYHAATNH
jgi:hypothetical protein